VHSWSIRSKARIARRALVAAFLLLGGAALADETSSDVAMAEALFQQGRQLMAAGRYREACPALEESLRLDRGTGTLWHLARCYEQTGRPASAWARYHELAAEARRLGEYRKEQAALRQARLLEPQLPTLIVEVPEENQTHRLVVRCDGAEVGRGAWGQPVPVDPGVHRVRAEAPGRVAWETTVRVPGPGEPARVAVPLLIPEVIPRSVSAPRTLSVAGAAPPWYRDSLGWALVGTGVTVGALGTLALLHASALRDDEDGTVAEWEERMATADRFSLAGTGLAALGLGTFAAGVLKLALVPRSAVPVVRGARRGLVFDLVTRF
jgi:tetratricopeptide (TPR) repeat protein